MATIRLSTVKPEYLNKAANLGASTTLNRSAAKEAAKKAHPSNPRSQEFRDQLKQHQDAARDTGRAKTLMSTVQGPASSAFQTRGAAFMDQVMRHGQN